MAFEDEWRDAKVKHRKRIVVRTCRQTGERYTLWSAYMKKATGEQRACAVLVVQDKKGKRLSIKKVSMKVGMELIAAVNQTQLPF